MQFTWQELIDRARVYVDDDHVDGDGWIAPERWLTIANVEYSQLYRRWVRMGLISPATVDASFTGYTHTLSGVLATVGVAQDLGGGLVRVLASAQETMGRAPFWSTNTGTTAPAQYWEANGSADSLSYTLTPHDGAGTYFIRYVPTVAYATDATTTIDLPYGADERLVLGMARRAHIKDSANSALVNKLIDDAEAELNFTAFGRGAGPRVRRVSSRGHGRRHTFPVDPRDWIYR